MLVTLVNQHTKRMRHIIIRSLYGSTHISPRYLINGTIFGIEHKQLLNFIVKPCIDMIIINNNQLMHISVFIKNTLKVYLKFLLPRHVSDHIGIHPQGAIIRS